MDEYGLADKIYELRKKKNLTQEDLAILLDISDKSVSKWENGTSKPTIEHLKKISEIFDVSLDDLIEIKEVQPLNIEAISLKTQLDTSI